MSNVVRCLSVQQNPLPSPASKVLKWKLFRDFLAGFLFFPLFAYVIFRINASEGFFISCIKFVYVLRIFLCDVQVGFSLEKDSLKIGGLYVYEKFSCKGPV